MGGGVSLLRVDTMRIPLAVDQRDFRWELLANILNLFDSRETRKIVARHKRLESIDFFKVVLTSMFFSTTIKYVVEELESREELREFLGVKDVPSENQVYSFLCRFELESFVSMVLSVLNSTTRKRSRNTRLLVDCTDVTVDFNYLRNHVKQKDLEFKDYRWGYSTKGLFIGMKLTLVLEYPSLKPLLFLMHPANKHESPLYPEIMGELKRRRIMRKGDTLFLDRGFYSYKNYLMGVNEYGVIPLIFPRSNFKPEKLEGMLSYPLTIFNSSNLEREKNRYKKLKGRLISMLKNWKKFKPIRSAIEDVFKLGKSMGLKKLHRYTMKSVHKYSALNVLLIGITISLGLREKKVIQSLAEG